MWVPTECLCSLRIAQLELNMLMEFYCVILIYTESGMNQSCFYRQYFFLAIDVWKNQDRCVALYHFLGRMRGRYSLLNVSSTHTVI